MIEFLPLWAVVLSSVTVPPPVQSGAYIGQVALDQPDSKSSEICAKVAGRSAAVAARARMEVFENILKIAKRVW